MKTINSSYHFTSLYFRRYFSQLFWLRDNAGDQGHSIFPWRTLCSGHHGRQEVQGYQQRDEGRIWRSFSGVPQGLSGGGVGTGRITVSPWPDKDGSSVLVQCPRCGYEDWDSLTLWFDASSRGALLEPSLWSCLGLVGPRHPSTGLTGTATNSLPRASQEKIGGHRTYYCFPCSAEFKRVIQIIEK